MKSKLIALLLLSSCLGLPAFAQDASEIGTQTTEVTPEAATSANTSDASSGIDAMVERVNIITRANSLTELPENDPVPLDLGLVDVPGVSSKLTKGVTAKAYARYVSVDDMKIGQLVLSSVEKGDRIEPLNSDNFVAQFDLNQPTLDPSSPISVEGDKAELQAALERLATQVTEEEPEEEVAETGVGASKGNTGSNASTNPDASSYSTPASLDVGKEPVITSNITAEGCEVRVDIDQLQAVQQTRVVTMTDGSPEYSKCADGDMRFKIEKSYNSCPYDEDLETMKATAQFIYYYNDAGGNRVEHGDCQFDEEKIYDIVENTDLCRVTMDYEKLQVITYGKLVYENHNGVQEVVRDCAPSSKVEPAVLTPTEEGCGIRDDFLAGVSYQRGKYTYELNGIPYDTACNDNGTEYAHETVYLTASGDNVCQPIVSDDKTRVTLQSRVQIEVNGMPQYRTPCTPDSNQEQVFSTTEGCENPATWNHNLNTGQSFGQERFFYKIDGAQKRIGDCQDSTEVFTHQIETVGWQPHDEKLFAYPLTTVYITGTKLNTPDGRFNIVTSQVLEGAVQTPYTYVSTEDLPTGKIDYEGCTRFDERRETEIYTRPDNTTHNLVIGEADPLDLGNQCETRIVWAADVQRRARDCGSTTLNNLKHRVRVSENIDVCEKRGSTRTGANNCSYTSAVATRSVVREDGEIIGTPEQNTCELRNLNPGVYQPGCAYVQYSTSYPSYPNLTNSAKTTCLGNWAWW